MSWPVDALLPLLLVYATGVSECTLIKEDSEPTNYFFSEKRYSAQKTLKFCQTKGGQLVILDTREKFQRVTSLLRPYSDKYDRFYVNAQQKSGKTYLWANGVKVKASLWGEGQPEVNRSYVQLKSNKGSFLLASAYGSYLRHALCENVTSVSSQVSSSMESTSGLLSSGEYTTVQKSGSLEMSTHLSNVGPSSATELFMSTTCSRSEELVPPSTSFLSQSGQYQDLDGSISLPSVFFTKSSVIIGTLNSIVPEQDIQTTNRPDESETYAGIQPTRLSDFSAEGTILGKSETPTEIQSSLEQPDVSQTLSKFGTAHQIVLTESLESSLLIIVPTSVSLTSRLSDQTIPLTSASGLLASPITASDQFISVTDPVSDQFILSEFNQSQSFASGSSSTSDFTIPHKSASGLFTPQTSTSNLFSSETSSSDLSASETSSLDMLVSETRDSSLFISPTPASTELVSSEPALGTLLSQAVESEPQVSVQSALLDSFLSETSEQDSSPFSSENIASVMLTNNSSSQYTSESLVSLSSSTLAITSLSENWVPSSTTSSPSSSSLSPPLSSSSILTENSPISRSLFFFSSTTETSPFTMTLMAADSLSRNILSISLWSLSQSSFSTIQATMSSQDLSSVPTTSTVLSSSSSLSPSSSSTTVQASIFPSPTVSSLSPLSSNLSSPTKSQATLAPQSMSTSSSVSSEPSTSPSSTSKATSTSSSTWQKPSRGGTKGAGCCTCRLEPKVTGTQGSSEARSAVDIQVARTKAELTLDTTALSKQQRKRHSATDTRPSSETMGVVSIAILTVMFVAVVCSDLVCSCRYLKQKVY